MRLLMRGADRQRARYWLIFLLVAFLVATPAVFLVLGSLSTARLPTEFHLAQFGLQHYREVWLDPATYRLFWKTLIYVSGATSFGLAIAVVLAWLVERTDLAGKVWIYAGVPLTLAMPGMLQSMAYVLLLSPRIGYLNKAMALLGLGPINIYSLGGMIFVEGMRLVPTAFLMLVPLLRAMDTLLEEAAAMSGAAPQAVLRTVSLRLMLPGLLAVVIYQAMTTLEGFEVPGILGAPAEIYVFSTKIYALLHPLVGLTPAYGAANALAMVYVVLAVGLSGLYLRVIARSERYTTVTGKSYRPKMIPLGGWHWLAWTVVVLFMMFSIILPTLVLLFVSFLPFLQQPSLAAFKSMSLANYGALLDDPSFGPIVWNTVKMVVLTSTLTVVLSFAVSLVIVRSRFWGRRILDQLAFIPNAIPGVVLGLAFVWLFLQGSKIGMDIHGGILSMAIVFTVSFMGYGTRAINAALLQLHKDLEEAASVCKAPPWQTLWRICLPLMLPTLAGVWIWSMLHAVRLVAQPLMLYEGEENEVLAILIWNMWDQGKVGQVGAIGGAMIFALFVITLVIRLISFGRRPISGPIPA